MQNPANLHIWHRALDLAVRIDAVARAIPYGRAPGLASQIRRAAMSIPANIAEGAGQQSPSQCARFMSIALGSAFELETHLVLLARLLPTIEPVDSALDETRQLKRMMHAFREHQRRRVEATTGSTAKEE